MNLPMLWHSSRFWDHLQGPYFGKSRTQNFVQIWISESPWPSLLPWLCRWTPFLRYLFNWTSDQLRPHMHLDRKIMYLFFNSWLCIWYIFDCQWLPSSGIWEAVCGSVFPALGICSCLYLESNPIDSSRGNRNIHHCWHEQKKQT